MKQEIREFLERRLHKVYASSMELSQAWGFPLDWLYCFAHVIPGDDLYQPDSAHYDSEQWLLCGPGNLGQAYQLVHYNNLPPMVLRQLEKQIELRNISIPITAASWVQAPSVDAFKEVFGVDVSHCDVALCCAGSLSSVYKVKTMKHDLLVDVEVPFFRYDSAAAGTPVDISLSEIKETLTHLQNPKYYMDKIYGY